MLFVCAVAAVYLLAACAVARMFLRRVGWVEKPARATLRAERVVLALAAGASLWVAGAAFGSTDKIHDALKVVPPGAFTILLYHTPDEILDVAATGRVDLYCAGHTHGGQVALPVYGALVTLWKFGKRYESGLHRERDTWLYVNRGIGMEGGPAPRVRFLARPEVTVIELAPPAAP